MKDDDKDGKIVKCLLNKRTVILEGTMETSLTKDVCNQLLSLQSESPEKINLIISSAGGSTFEAMMICDIITNLMTTPVRGIAIGKCCSAATFVMLHCNERISTPHARFLIHSGNIGGLNVSINDTTSENLEQLLKEVKAIEEKVFKLYMEKLTPKVWLKRKPPKAKRRQFVKSLIDRGDQNFDAFLSAEEALDIGLIERIETGKLGIF